LPYSGFDLLKYDIAPIVWNGASDKVFAANIDFVQNSTRANAAGIKITSNAHSADFPGIYFIWDSKQKDNGYLKVAGGVFDLFDSFVLTAKVSNTYWDFIIRPEKDQKMTNDGCYVFFIPKVNNNKNINMVFLSEWAEKTTADPSDGKEKQPSIDQGDGEKEPPPIDQDGEGEQPSIDQGDGEGGQPPIDQKEGEVEPPIVIPPEIIPDEQYPMDIIDLDVRIIRSDEYFWIDPNIWLSS